MNMKVILDLDELCNLKSLADLYDYHKSEIQKRDKEIAENNHATAKIVEELEAKMKEVTDENTALHHTLEEKEKANGEMLQMLNAANSELVKFRKSAETEKPITNARAYLDEHDTPFESDDAEKACEVIRALLAAKPEAEKPRELQPVTVTAISNAKDVLRALFRPFSSEEDAANETVPADRFQTVYKTLRDLVSRLEQEGLA